MGRKIDYDKIKWGADTMWEFCGSEKNLVEVLNRFNGNYGVRVPVEEFGVNAAVNVGRDIQSYLNDALTEYSDQYCSGDYLKPTRFEGRIVA